MNKKYLVMYTASFTDHSIFMEEVEAHDASEAQLTAMTKIKKARHKLTGREDGYLRLPYTIHDCIVICADKKDVEIS